MPRLPLGFPPLLFQNLPLAVVVVEEVEEEGEEEEVGYLGNH